MRMKRSIRIITTMAMKLLLLIFTHAFERCPLRGAFYPLPDAPATTGSELVSVEDPAPRYRFSSLEEPLAQGVELLDLLGDEPDDRVQVGAQL